MLTSANKMHGNTPKTLEMCKTKFHEKSQKNRANGFTVLPQCKKPEEAGQFCPAPAGIGLTSMVLQTFFHK